MTETTYSLEGNSEKQERIGLEMIVSGLEDLRATWAEYANAFESANGGGTPTSNAFRLCMGDLNNFIKELDKKQMKIIPMQTRK